MKAKRLGLLDAIRGIALFGILIVNLPFLANTIYSVRTTAPLSPLDTLASLFVSTFFELKFYLIFSFVFGYSFSLAFTGPGLGARRAEFTRRLLGLAVFGTLHAVFFFLGDILTSYAFLGGALWLVRDWHASRLCKMGTGLLCAAVGVYAGVAILTAPYFDYAVFASLQTRAEAAYLGTFWEGARQRLLDLRIAFPFLACVNWMPALGMFLWGLAAAKAELLKQPEQLLRNYRRYFAPLLIAGLLGNGFFAITDRYQQDSVIGLAGLSATPLFAPCLSFVYVYLIVWLWVRFSSHFSYFEAAGRMSLTNYLGQAVVAGAIFNGWGLGLLGRLGPASLLLLAVTIYSAQLPISKLYLRYFHFGPDEWLLRSFSRLQWQPLVRHVRDQT